VTTTGLHEQAKHTVHDADMLPASQALDVDIAGLPAGDATELGERGINVSGGRPLVLHSYETASAADTSSHASCMPLMAAQHCQLITRLLSSPDPAWLARACWPAAVRRSEG
jgi:hypothetical protein